MPTPGFGGPVAPVRQQFTDAEGRPLAGGRVYHYLPDTSTPTDTWADPDFSVLNTNPVVLDAAGRAVIYCDKLVRQVLYDRYGTLIWDGETVTNLGVNSSGAINLANISALRANTTNYPLFYLLGYYTPNDGQGGMFWLDVADTTTPDNGGTVIVDASGHRYKRQDNEGPIDVRKFGAKGDGVTVDTTSFTNAIAYGQASKKAVLQSQGAYITTTSPDDVSFSPLTLTKIAALRDNVVPYPVFWVLGYYAPRDGGGGFFQWDTTDNSTADNGGTVIIDADGRRYKRVDAEGILNILWFGAKGDGTTDDLPAFAAAAATGQSYYLPPIPDSYLVTGTVNHNTNGQFVYGSHRASPIKGTGNFNTFRFSGGADTCGMVDVYFASSGKTGGYDVAVDEAFRVRLQNLWFADPYAGFRILRTNNCIMDDVICTTFRGPHGGLMQGTDAAVCSVITLKDYKCSPSVSGVGGPALELDGRVSTLCLVSFQVNGQSAGASKMTHGLKASNTIGASQGPRFVWAYDTEIDYPKSHGVDMDDCLAFYFYGGYVQGAASNRLVADPPGHGVRYGEDCEHCLFSGFHMRGNSGNGFLCQGRDVSIHACDILNSSWIPELAKYDGVHCAATADRVRVVENRIGNTTGTGATTRYGVYAAAGSRNIVVSSNDLSGCRLGPFRDDSGDPIGSFTANGNIGAPYSWVGGVVTGSQAGFNGAATPTILAGVITGGIVTDPGFHYETAPTVTAYDPQGLGSGAVMGATVANGKIIAITGGGGSNYSADTVLTITAASGPVGVRTLTPNSTDAGLALIAQGAGTVQLGNESGEGLVVACTPNGANFVRVEGSASGSEVSISSSGSDPDVDLALLTRGAGYLRLDGAISPTAGSLIGYLAIKIGVNIVKIPYYNP